MVRGTVTNNPGTVTAEFTVSAQDYGELVSDRRSGATRQFHYDGLGSTAGLSNSSQTLANTDQYGAFGTLLSSTGSGTNPYQWVGKLGYYKDSTSGLYSLRRRDYRSQNGRFVSEDPLGFAGGDANLYGYVANSPLNYGDPSGLQQQTVRRPLGGSLSGGPPIYQRLGGSAFPGVPCARGCHQGPGTPPTGGGPSIDDTIDWFGRPRPPWRNLFPSPPQPAPPPRPRVPDLGARNDLFNVLCEEPDRCGRAGTPQDNRLEAAWDKYDQGLSPAEIDKLAAEMNQACTTGIDWFTMLAPYVSDVRDGVEAVTGHDYINDRDLSIVERIITVVAFFIPVVPGGILRRLFGPPLRRLLDWLDGTIGRRCGDALDGVKRKIQELLDGMHGGPDAPPSKGDMPCPTGDCTPDGGAPPKQPTPEPGPPAETIPTPPAPLRSGSEYPHRFKPGVILDPNDPWINTLKNRMRKNGWQGEPIIVRILDDGTMEILDGHHRVEAAKRAGLSKIPWREATCEEAESFLKHRQ